MISLPEQSTTALRRRTRRRISNQVAAFAAIMLFASTQVSLPKDADMVASQAISGLATVSDNSVQGVRGFPLDEPAIGSAESSKNSKSSDSRGRQRLNLNLFRLRP